MLIWAVCPQCFRDNRGRGTCRGPPCFPCCLWQVSRVSVEFWQKSVWLSLFDLISQNLVKITAVWPLNTQQKHSWGTGAPLLRVNTFITHFYRKRFHPGQFALVPFHCSSQLCSSSGADPDRHGETRQFRLSGRGQVGRLDWPFDLPRRNPHMFTAASQNWFMPRRLNRTFSFCHNGHVAAAAHKEETEPFIVPYIFPLCRFSLTYLQ